MARSLGRRTVLLIVLLGALGASSVYALLRVGGVESSPRPVLSTAIERLPGDAAALRLDASGLAPGASHVVILRAGTCEMPSASGGRLGTMVADSDGRGTLRAISVASGAVGEPTQLTIALLLDGEHLVELREVSGAAPVCVELPR